MEENINIEITNENEIENFDKVLEGEITNKLKEVYNKGVVDGAMAGWDACVQHIYMITKDMTSANKIHKFMKKEMDEVKVRERIIVDKEEDNEE